MIAMFSHLCLGCQRRWSATMRCGACVYCGHDVLIVWDAEQPDRFYCDHQAARAA